MSANFVHSACRADGQRTVGGFLGTAMRHCRRAVEINLRHGPTAGVAASVQQAREALDGVVWLCEYVEGDR